MQAILTITIAFISGYLLCRFRVQRVMEGAVERLHDATATYNKAMRVYDEAATMNEQSVEAERKAIVLYHELQTLLREDGVWAWLSSTLRHDERDRILSAFTHGKIVVRTNHADGHWPRIDFLPPELRNDPPLLDAHLGVDNEVCRSCLCVAVRTTDNSRYACVHGHVWGATS